MTDLTNPTFTNEEEARKFLEKVRWPNGAVCPHCKKIECVAPLGGANKVVETDETFVGGKAKNRAYREPAPKKAVLTLVEREGRCAPLKGSRASASRIAYLVKPRMLKQQ